MSFQFREKDVVLDSVKCFLTVTTVDWKIQLQFFGHITKELMPTHLSIVLKSMTFFIFNISVLFGSGNHIMFSSL